MKGKIKRLPIGLAVAALVLTATLSIGGAMAYFTTYSTASGGVTLNMGFTTTRPDETIDGNSKIVRIENTGDYDCFVRARAFSTQNLEYTLGEGWSEGDDGYYYYDEILGAKESTTELKVTITFPEDKSDVDVIVVQECTPVLYDEDGVAYANWNNVITDSTTEAE